MKGVRHKNIPQRSESYKTIEFSTKRGYRSKKDASFCGLVNVEMFRERAGKGKRLEEKVIKFEGKPKCQKERNEELRNKNENFTKEMNRKDVEIN